jgi:hypothetical protein
MIRTQLTCTARVQRRRRADDIARIRMSCADFSSECTQGLACEGHSVQTELVNVFGTVRGILLIP